MSNTVLDWQPWGMCSVQAKLPNGHLVIVSGWGNGSGTKGGFALTYRFGRYDFSTRADAYMAAELLATALGHA